MWKKEQIKGFLEKVIIIFSEGARNYSVVFEDN